MKKRQVPRVARELPDLLEALRRNVRLVRELCERAFQGGDPDYLGEVAAKLRLLVDDAGGRPLLLSLMKVFDTRILITVGGPPIEAPPGRPGPGDEVTLGQYLGLTAYGIRTPSGTWVELTEKELIRTWAAQHGAAHEDWGLDEGFQAARDSGLFIGGLPALGAELRTTAATVLWVAEQFLGSLTSELIKLKTAERAFARNPAPAAHRALAIALAESGRGEEAIEHFSALAEYEPTKAESHYNLGLVLYQIGHLEEAGKSYRRAIQVDERYVNAHYNLAGLFSLQGDFESCLQEIEIILRLASLTNLDDDLASDPDFTNSRMSAMAAAVPLWLVKVVKERDGRVRVEAVLG